MVVENVTIVVRERGAKATAKNIRTVGKASGKASKAVLGLTAALTGFFTVRGLSRIASDSIAAAAGFEQFGIRLGALLGSQREANTALANFTKLASETPFAVSQIVEGATALGAAALGNRERLEELTQTAANLAAVTGLSFQDAAGNLQRALSAGIGAADLFRERGVRALIESIKGIPDATKLTKTELDAAFRDVFGEGGVFGRAAQDLSNTLGGALSNIGDAATNTKVALGNAFAPSVIAVARRAIIPFLQNLQKLVEDNEGEIRDFAATFLKSLVSSFVLTARAGIAVVQAFQEIGQGGRFLIGTVREIQLTFAELLLVLEKADRFLGLGSVEELEAAEATVATLKGQIAGYAGEVRQAGIENAEFAAGLDAINEQLAALERATEGADLTTTGPAAPDIELPAGAGAGDAIDAEAVKKAATAREKAEKRVLKLTDQLKISSAARVSQLDAQLERLRQQAIELRTAAVAAGDETLAREGLLLIEGQIASVRQEQIDKLAQAAVEARKLADRRRGEAAKEIGGKLIEGIETGGKSALQDLASFGQDAFAEAFGSAMQDAGTALKDILSEAFSGIDFGSIFGGQSGAISQAFSGALGIGASILAKELGGTSATARNDLVRSATQSVQATRGVIAGPTSIPVFQVGQQLEAAMSETESLLERILRAIQAQPTSGAGGTAVAGGAAADLSSTTPSLA